MKLKALGNLALASVLVLGVLSASCSPKRVRKSQLADKQSAQNGEEPESAYTPGVEVTEASLRGSEFASVEGLDPIYFDYDNSSLKEGALETLKKNAQYLKQNKDKEVLVAGFCDERGTIEYNLALGQKRSREVREYYIRLGVPGKSIATLSYGKETPSCFEATEKCWAENRRAETRIRASTAANGHPPPHRVQ